MAFNYPATEIFDAQGTTRVVWSEEEYAQALTDGWLAERPVEPTAVMIEEPKKQRAVEPTDDVTHEPKKRGKAS